jgi:predicted cupin superfamily sugar epimerase
VAELGKRAAALIKRLGLQPHPEGGYFVETYRSSLRVQTPRGERAACTTILYLLPEARFSPLHRVPGDEVWSYYDGSAVELTLLDPQTGATTLKLGNRLPQWELPQQVVPGGVWQSARCTSGWSLLGCTVSPGFEFADFEMPPRRKLLELLPQALHPDVLRLTLEGEG